MPESLLPPKNLHSPFAQAKADHVGLQVGDLEATTRWYVETLDFRVSKEASADPLRFVYLYPPADDAFRIELVGGASPSAQPAYDDLPGSMGTAGFHHLCLNVENVDAVAAELRRRDVRILAGPFYNASVGQSLLFAADPWGNVIEFAQDVLAGEVSA